MALPQNIIDAQAQSQALASKAGEFATALPTISDELNKRVKTLYNENADVLGLFNQGVSDLVAAPGKLGQRMGTIGDIVGQSTRAFQAQSQAAQTAAELARQKYQDVLQQFQIQEDIRIQNEQLAIQRAAAARSSGPSAGERETAEIRKLISEAGKLPENQRAAYIISNGYNPNDSNFTGLFAAKVDQNKAAQLKKTEAETAKLTRESEAAAEKKEKAKWQIWNPFSWFD